MTYFLGYISYLRVMTFFISKTKENVYRYKRLNFGEPSPK